MPSDLTCNNLQWNIIQTFLSSEFIVLGAVLSKVHGCASLVTQCSLQRGHSFWVNPIQQIGPKVGSRRFFKGGQALFRETAVLYISYEVNVGHCGGKREWKMDHSYTCSYVFLQTHRNMYVYFVYIHKAVQTWTQNLWVECVALSSSHPQTKFLVCALWPLIGTGHLHWENWSLIIKQINMLSH